MDFTKLDKFIDDMPKRGIPMFDLAVSYKGETVYRHMSGHSDEALTVPTSENDLYWIFSNTKVMTCICAMRLLEEGKIALEDKLSKYIPEFETMFGAEGFKWGDWNKDGEVNDADAAYAPDFSNQKYGYYQTVQTDSLGSHKVYSPYSNQPYGVPGAGQQANINFSLSQSLEMKVLSKRDTSGVKKIKLIDELRISGSYNFLADSLGLSNLPISFRTTLYKNFGLNLSFTLDPYEVTPEGIRTNKLMMKRGILGRITSTGWSFGYTFKSRENKSTPAANDINSIPPEYFNPFSDPYGLMDPTLRRHYMASSYYDFSIPWNIGFNYVISYSIAYTNNGTTGFKRNVSQTIGFNGSVNLTPKTGITFTTGFDIQNRKLTTTSISITRDLHCWQMSFVWIPFGTHKSWSFNIGVKASSLADLKYDKSQSMYDNLF